jgi:DNA-binding transcriptional regulator GbsR (MarR family)
VAVLGELLADPAMSKEPTEAKLRVKETLELLQTLTAWSDEMLRLDTETLTKVLRLGAKVKKLLGRETADGAPAVIAGTQREITAADLLGP